MNKTCHGLQGSSYVLSLHFINWLHSILSSTSYTSCLIIHLHSYHKKISPIFQKHSIPWLKCSTGTFCSSTDILPLIRLSAARKSFRSYKPWRHQSADIRVAKKWPSVSMNQKHQENYEDSSKGEQRRQRLQKSNEIQR